MIRDIKHIPCRVCASITRDIRIRDKLYVILCILPCQISKSNACKNYDKWFFQTLMGKCGTKTTFILPTQPLQ